MKDKRRSTILQLIDTFDIETQEELAEKLRERGFAVTQATISRDIKELNLIKIQTRNGFSKYSINENMSHINTEKLLRVFKETVLDISTAGNLIVLKTMSASANAAAEAVDLLNIEEIVGCIAGDNTIFLAISDIKMVEIVAKKLYDMMI